jgi:hypothetical protein
MRKRRKKTVLPGSLERLRKRFESWRQQREKGTRIPEELWQAAMEQSANLGVNQVSQALRLNYNDFKKRIKSSGKPVVSVSEQPAFVEVALNRVDGARECVVEIESSAGDRMKLRFRGESAMDVIEWSRAFWRPGS